MSVLLVGDLHIGHAATDERMIERTRKRLGEERTYWIQLGDAIDAINRRDPRFDPRSVADWIGLKDLVDIAGAQIARFKHYFGRLGGTCLASIIGNHEAAMQKHSEYDVFGAINKAMGIDEERILGLSGFLRLRFREIMPSGKHRNTWTQVIYLHHGSGGGALAGGKALKLQRLPGSYIADVYVQGHTHSPMVVTQQVLLPGKRAGDVIEKDLIMVTTGAYLGRAAYAEAKQYPPQVRGAVELIFYPSERRVQVVV